MMVNIYNIVTMQCQMYPRLVLNFPKGRGILMARNLANLKYLNGF